MCLIIFLPDAWSILNIIQEAFLCSGLPNLFLEGNNKRKEEQFFNSFGFVNCHSG